MPRKKSRKSFDENTIWFRGAGDIWSYMGICRRKKKEEEDREKSRKHWRRKRGSKK